MQYMTAFALIEVAEIGLDDGVIVRAASSSVGIAAIQLANWAGAVSIAATRTSAKADALREQGAAHVVATEEEDLVAAGDGDHRRQGRVCRVRSGRRPLCRDAGDRAAPRGILFIYGGLSEQPTPYPHWQCAFKGLSMRGWVASEIWNHPQRFKPRKGNDPRRSGGRPAQAGHREAVLGPRGVARGERVPRI